MAVPLARNRSRHRESVTHPDGGERWKVDLEDFLDVARAVAAGTPLDEALVRMVKVARRGLGATGVVVVQVHPAGFHEIRAKDVAAGLQARLRSLFHRYRVALERSLERGAPFLSHQEGDTVLVAPLQTSEEQHYLAVWFSETAWTPDAGEQQLIDALAAHSTAALARGQEAFDQVSAAVGAERDRLARELHDVVIQRVFAAGLQIKALTRCDNLATMRVGLDTVADSLEQVLGDIRSAIFGLTDGPECCPGDAVRGLVAEYARTLGFTPLLAITGEVDRIGSVVSGHLVATLRELLSNVARHSGASGCRVDVTLEHGHLTLLVGDNGGGIRPGTPRSGLENVRLRASLLGGTCEVEPNRPGTLVRWRVPVADRRPGAGSGPPHPLPSLS